MEVISSPQNQKVKWLAKLHDSATRRAESLFLVEGTKEINLALNNNFTPHSLFVRGDKHSVAEHFKGLPQFSMPSEVFNRVTYRRTSSALAVFHIPKSSLADIKLGPNPLLIIAESIEKPGNLGAILRVADGVGADAVIVCGEFKDIYNPNVIRSSVGCVFSVPLTLAEPGQIKEFCDQHKIECYGAALAPGAKNYTSCAMAGSTALIVGNEAKGLSEFWLVNSQLIKIPMHGQNNSLNVSTATAVLAYEVLRQRGDSR